MSEKNSWTAEVALSLSNPEFQIPIPQLIVVPQKFQKTIIIRVPAEDSSQNLRKYEDSGCHYFALRVSFFVVCTSICKILNCGVMQILTCFYIFYLSYTLYTFVNASWFEFVKKASILLIFLLYLLNLHTLEVWPTYSTELYLNLHYLRNLNRMFVQVINESTRITDTSDFFLSNTELIKVTETIGWHNVGLLIVLL